MKGAESTNQQGFCRLITTNGNSCSTRTSFGETYFTLCDSRAIQFWVKGLGIMKVGTGHWLKTKILRCLISMRRHSRDSQVHAVWILMGRKDAEPVIETPLLDIPQVEVCVGFKLPRNGLKRLEKKPAFLFFYFFF